MGTQGRNSVDRIDAVVKTLDVLEALWQADGAGVTEVTERTGLAKSTVHAHLTTLRSKGYVVQEGDEYRLSLRFLSFGEHVKHAEPLYEASKTPIADLAEQTGERVLCSTVQNGLGTVLRTCDGDRSVPSDITVGTHTYLHCSAGGKAMLAHFDEERVADIVDTWGLPAFSDETITTWDELTAELETVREEGLAYNHGEYLPGLSAVGAPILDNDDTVYGAVSISGPTHRLESEWDIDDLHNQLLSAANTIEVNLLFT
ncbi:IclR family transcription regulator [Natrialba magadii ATCC 43099]|uniref:IclR family transcription regulator n=1 Tax=Natrialba magadii (strain ATCC 43099 / DSM 3394 / CCM 3739 / CIP 104546 / IAM 13178 / JCM 8861 / NBRC 102185 / NCIMB 2190 / MS3) TaxID=547559 RepID=D3ST99_NATMM|nr:IclR family transcriptional regulator [Natrialba magadii]ADD06966.1 IclR family transcription regulator [Natrialba magadii ATCC 43099]